MITLVTGQTETLVKNWVLEDSKKVSNQKPYKIKDFMISPLAKTLYWKTGSFSNIRKTFFVASLCRNYKDYQSYVPTWDHNLFLLFRIALLERELKVEDFRVVFVENEAKEIEIDQDGKLTEGYPTGFFDFGENLLGTIFKLQKK